MRDPDSLIDDRNADEVLQNRVDDAFANLERSKLRMFENAVDRASFRLRRLSELNLELAVHTAENAQGNLSEVECREKVREFSNEAQLVLWGQRDPQPSQTIWLRS